MPDIEIEVDGLSVPVDADEYEADPEGVVERVRAARAEYRANQEQFESAPDYDEFLAQFGGGGL